ncbi:RICIN domain-containing protein [Streptomyces goshikiensis]|uniref:RICIN domain-containing protein n=2 Tax=Streptomyces TaxID=1883 RepID=A0ABZ1RF72_9ACTN|nr:MULTISPECIES: RICIN domain-containing protein [Streptomyces]RPK33170.1 Ricin-type beta-trefoil lectin domain protein [Streptomyces sp. ADI91-18]WBY23482.1 RICIN domain-containing protein [Streptomyces goshikiensis]WSS02377.1 RICIN domain-containing protein [Streptomyces goshikiensis]
MTGNRRKQREHRRRPRRFILVTAALASAAVLAGGIAYSGLGDDAQAGPAEAGGALADTVVPAAAPARDEEPAPIVGEPAEADAKRGMVFDGLKAAPKGDRCVGVYRTEGGLCTHGPDAPPKGVDIKKDIEPAVKSKAPAADPAKPQAGDPASTEGGGRPQDAPAADASSAKAAPAAAPAPAAASGSQGVAAGPAGQTVQCDGDGSTGNRVQVVYVHGSDRDRYAEYVASFRKWAADADLIYSASAKETGGVRHIRYVTAADCTPTVLNIELPASALSEFSATNNALAGKGLDRRDRKYMIFADTQVYCGIGTFNGDERPGQTNQSNFGPSYGRTDSGCWGGHTAAHELGHNLGAVNNSAPNTSRGAHCTDEWDVMCYSDTPYYPQMRNVCTNQASENILDCNHDDYFHTNPKPGSYLATHWNIADNQFLMKGNGGGGTTNPDPSPKPTASPTSKPTPTPTPTKQPTGGPTVTAGQIQADSVVVSWPKVDGAAWYQVLLGGKHLTWVQSTALRIYNLQPGTEYKVAVSVRDGSGRDTGPGKTTSFRTTSKGGGTTTPNTRYLLGNGSTGMNAELWGGRTADNTVLVGGRANGYAQQQWYFDDAGSGLVRVRSAVSGKCLQMGGAPAAGMWIAQQPCGSGAAQKWKMSASGGGMTLADSSGGFALTVSNRPYYGYWLLDLQKADGRPAQVWTVQKAG